MKIKLAILENDTCYLQRIVSVFGSRYSDKMELYSFSEMNHAIASLKQARIDVLVASDAFDIDVTLLPKRCGFAYFVDSSDIDSHNGQPVICKFQKADLIYKQILSLYSENAGNYSGLRGNSDGTKVLLFSSPCGGCGTSSMAAACAMHYSLQGKKTIYLNMEYFGTSDVFFSADGQFGMSDIIYAFKSRKSNLAMKIESCVKQSPQGVYFFSGTKNALDMLEFEAEDMIRLINELSIAGTYDYIILDMDFSMRKDALPILHYANSIVWISDGSVPANNKIVRAFQTLTIQEQKEDFPISNKVALLYNRFSNKSGQMIDIGIKAIGGAPKYEYSTVGQLLDSLSKLAVFDAIL